MRQSSEDGPILVAQTGPLNGQRWVLRPGFIIGRDSDCDIMIPNRQVSRHHIRFQHDKQGVWLEDLDSKNGTHHNGKVIKNRILLQDGDVIQVALAQQFVYLSSDATMPLNGNIDLSFGGVEHAPQKRLKLEKRSRRVHILGVEISPPLSVSQFRLLELLYDNPGRVISRVEVIETVWGEENAITVSEQALDALVRRLRDRFAEVDSSHQYIVTIRGHGLLLDNPED
jgi:hypothetical protein